MELGDILSGLTFDRRDSQGNFLCENFLDKYMLILPHEYIDKEKSPEANLSDLEFFTYRIDNNKIYVAPFDKIYQVFNDIISSSSSNKLREDWNTLKQLWSRFFKPFDEDIEEKWHIYYKYYEKLKSKNLFFIKINNDTTKKVIPGVIDKFVSYILFGTKINSSLKQLKNQKKYITLSGHRIKTNPDLSEMIIIPPKINVISKLKANLILNQKKYVLKIFFFPPLKFSKWHFSIYKHVLSEPELNNLRNIYKQKKIESDYWSEIFPDDCKKLQKMVLQKKIFSGCVNEKQKEQSNCNETCSRKVFKNIHNQILGLCYCFYNRILEILINDIKFKKKIIMSDKVSIESVNNFIHELRFTFSLNFPTNINTSLIAVLSGFIYLPESSDYQKSFILNLLTSYIRTNKFIPLKKQSPEKEQNTSSQLILIEVEDQIKI